MKKTFFSLLLLLTITTGINAQTDPVPMANTPSTQLENNTMFFNPAQNGYYTTMYRSYWVWDVATLSWVKRVELVTPAPNTPLSNPPVLYNNTGIPYQATYESNPAKTVPAKPKPREE